MRNVLLLILINSSFLIAHSQFSQTIHTSGAYIIGPCGDTLMLRGVNYAPYNWGWDEDELRIDEIATSGANCVRLVWYVDAGNATPNSVYQDINRLDTVLQHCIAHRLIPILELHDVTCQNDTSKLKTLAQFYLQPDVLSLIQRYEHSLIINIANETLYVQWASNAAKAAAAFVQSYVEVIQQMRSHGIQLPLMIDAPDCGQNLKFISDSGMTLINSDPLHNIILSAHAYWYGYANNDSVEFQQELDDAMAKGIPFILGEIANLQDDASMCQYVLNYRALLHLCQQRHISWLAWSWDHDVCSQRQMTVNGEFSNLTVYGNDLLNHPDYGLNSSPVAKSKFLTTGCLAVDVDDDLLLADVHLYPNPSSMNNVQLTMTNDLAGSKLEVYDANGRLVFQTAIRQSSSAISLPVSKGVYFFRVHSERASVVKRWVKL